MKYLKDKSKEFQSSSELQNISSEPKTAVEMHTNLIREEPGTVEQLIAQPIRQDIGIF